MTSPLNLKKCCSFLVGDDYSDSDHENENETVIKEMEQHVPGQDPASDKEDSVAEDAMQTHPLHEEDTDIVDDSDRDPNYNPSSDESSAPETEDNLVAMVAATPEQHGPHQEPRNVDGNNNVSFS